MTTTLFGHLCLSFDFLQNQNDNKIDKTKTTRHKCFYSLPNIVIALTSSQLLEPFFSLVLDRQIAADSIFSGILPRGRTSGSLTTQVGQKLLHRFTTAPVDAVAVQCSVFRVGTISYESSMGLILVTSSLPNMFWSNLLWCVTAPRSIPHRTSEQGGAGALVDAADASLAEELLGAVERAGVLGRTGARRLDLRGHGTHAL